MTDETPHRRWPALVVATAAILTLIGVVIALIVLSRRVDFTFGSTDGTGATRVSIPLLFFGAVEGTFLYASMAAMAVESAEVRQRLSRIFWPIFAVKVTLALTVSFSAVTQGRAGRFAAFDLPCPDVAPRSAAFRAWMVKGAGCLTDCLYGDAHPHCDGDCH